MSEVQIGSAKQDEISDMEVRKFIDRVADLMKLEILHSLAAKASPGVSALKLAPLMVGNKAQKSYPSVGMAVDNWVEKKAPAAKSQILKRALERPPLSPTLKTFGREIGFDVKSAKYGLQQINLATSFAFVNANFAGKLMSSIFDRFDFISPGPATGPAPVVVNRGLKLYAKKVKCNDETDPEWLGQDEISLGGVAVDDKGVVTEINAFNVGNFDDGTTKNYSPSKLLKNFSVSGAEYPKTFAGFLSLAEKDSGGFSNFLDELYDAIKAEVTVILTALGAAAGAAIGAAIGGTVGTVVGGPIGTIIGVVAGLILGALISWLVSLLEDDIFEPQVTTVTLPSADSDFNGSLTSPTMNFVYRDFGGKYTLSYYWEIVR